MQEEQRASSLVRSPWFVYIVLCRDGSYYTGITTNLIRRMAEHNSPKGGAKYTRSRRPVTLVYYEAASSRSAAAQREYRIKKMHASGKIRLIAETSISEILVPPTLG